MQNTRNDRFNKNAIYKVEDINGYGIWDKQNKCFIGFYTNRGFVTVWNEIKKAKLAFSYHTNNTLSEREDEYEVRQLTSKIY